MKNINNLYRVLSGLFLLLIFSVVFISCEEELDISLPSHRVILSSQTTNSNTINVGSIIDFADVSQGVVSRQWNFPESANIVDGNSQSVNVSAEFLQSGVFEISLNQVFMDSAFVEREEEKRGNELDTIITVNVLPFVNVTSLTANLLEDGELGSAIPLQNGGLSEIFAGSTVRFTYEAIGDPNEISGNFDGGTLVGQDPENNTFDVKYGSLDNFDINAFFRRTSPQSIDTFTVSNAIKAIASTEPVTVSQIFDEEGDIAIQFSRDLDGSSVNAADFDVRIMTLAGTTLNPSVSDAVLSNVDASVVILSLDEDQVYSDDDVFVSYNPGELVSADLKAVDLFTDIQLEHVVVNFFESSNFDYSFEREADVEWVRQDLYGFIPANPNYTSEISTEQVRSGSKSIKVTTQANSTSVSIVAKNSSDGSRHTYTSPNDILVQSSAWIYVESAPTSGNCFMRLRLGEYEFPWNLQDAICGFTDGSGGFPTALPTGEWVQVKEIVTVNLQENDPVVIINPVNFTSEGLTFFLDDLVIQPWNPRP